MPLARAGVFEALAETGFEPARDQRSDVSLMPSFWRRLMLSFAMISTIREMSISNIRNKRGVVYSELAWIGGDRFYGNVPARHIGADTHHRIRWDQNR